MNLASPWWLLLGLAAIPVLAIHMLRPRRRSVEVSSVWLWRPAAQQVTARSPWQRLRKSWPLLAQLIAVALLALGAAQPGTTEPTTFGRHTVFIVDTSVSMTARDVKGSRFGAMQSTAKRLANKLPSSSLASVVTSEGVVRLSTSSDRSAFERTINALRPSTGASRWDRATLLAKGLQTAESDTRFVLVSDGGLSETEQRLLPVGTRFEPVGKSADNLSLSDPVVLPQATGVSVAATVTNASAKQQTTTLELYVDNVKQTAKRVSIKASSSSTVRFDIRTGDKIELRLVNTSGEDHLSADDRLFTTVGERRKLNVQLVTTADPQSLFIERALQALPDVALISGNSTTIAPKTEVVVFDRVQPPANLAIPAIVLAPPQGYGPIAVLPAGGAQFPVPTLVRSNHPLLTGLDLSNIVIETAQRVDAGDTQVLVGAPETPLIMQGRTDLSRFVYWSFAPSSSTIALDISFPVLVDRMVSDLGGAEVTGGAVDIGAVLSPSLQDRTLTSPTGQTTSVLRGESGPTLDVPGFWTVSEKNGQTGDAIAVNTPNVEHDIAPKTTLRSAPQDADTEIRRGVTRTSRLRWVAASIIGIVGIEWLLVRRRVGVGTKQWRFAQATRVGVALLALAALVAPFIRVPSRNVSTVFAIDASDSLGPGGRRDAVAFVEDALSTMPANSRAGVVVFGGTAQVTAAVQRQLSLGDVSGAIDASNTDLANALRLAGAASPGDAARRVVIVSDGRRTIGDEAAAAEELADADIRLDAAIAGRPNTADVAVDSFRAPTKAERGERIVLQANLRATVATSAEVVVKADGREIARDKIALRAGDNNWSAEVQASDEGVATYSIEVVSQQDGVVQNDVGYAATAIAGATRVLVLTGDSNSYVTGGNGSSEIAQALRQSGLEVVAKRASELDGLEDLAGVSAVVVVDAHRREFNDAQVDVLTGAVRELGIGLTVVGGTNSFGSGGYLGSRLEDLLPVVSEVADPKRRTPVAEGIIIDTSGSMSAPVDGKRTALDLAKAGALGAVGALDEGDKVGVMGVDDDREWVMNVQDVPSSSEAEKQISKLQVGGGTVIEGSLTEVAQQLTDSKAGVRHIVVLSDGYTSDVNALISEAAALHAQGFTITAVGAGPDIEPNFAKVAAAGGGRFVPGGDFANLPAVFIEETQTVARNLINEGEFVPEITAAVAAVRDLDAAPALQGFQATTPRPTARTALRVGPYQDPLLSSWQAGLGKVTVWSSDGGQRWASGWRALEQPFWASVVKDTILRGGTGTVRATIDDGNLSIRAVGPGWGTGATASAVVRGPDGTAISVQLRRTADGSFVGTTEAPKAGTYAVGVAVSPGSAGGVDGAGGAGSVGSAGPAESSGGSSGGFSGGATAIRGYSAEYEPGTIDQDRLKRLSARTGGRGLITADQVFSRDGLVPGKRLVNLAPWLLLAAAMLWVLAIVLWRIPVGRTPKQGKPTAKPGDPDAPNDPEGLEDLDGLDGLAQLVRARRHPGTDVNASRVP